MLATNGNATATTATTIIAAAAVSPSLLCLVIPVTHSVISSVMSGACPVTTAVLIIRVNVRTAVSVLWADVDYLWYTFQNIIDYKVSAADATRSKKRIQDLDSATVNDRITRKMATVCMKTVVHRQ